MEKPKGGLVPEEQVKIWYKSKKGTQKPVIKITGIKGIIIDTSTKEEESETISHWEVEYTCNIFIPNVIKATAIMWWNGNPDLKEIKKFLTDLMNFEK